MARPQRIIVGIDFGTTSTIVAWATTAPPIQIELLHNWPTCGPPVGSYVPTEIAYTDNDPLKFTWGYNIPTKSRRIQWFKLGLETTEAVLPLPPNKSATDVVSDFLTVVRGHMWRTLSRRFGEGVLASYRLEHFLTVPAIWSDAAKQRTLTAAIHAGFPKDRLELISEPECAALYTLRNIETSYSPFKPGDRIVVCDAGGGTVDVITYDIIQLQPRLTVKEVGTGIGDFCGSTFIDQEFESFFKASMGLAYDTISEANRRQVAKSFEAAKLAFRDEPQQDALYVTVPGITDMESAGIVDGQFEVSRAQMRALFNPVLENTIKLLEDQVQTAITAGRRVGSVLLVGGFGESEYLFQKIKTWAAPQGIQVIQPRDARTAIAQGAVYKGLEDEPNYQTEVIRRARRSYGFPTSERFVDGYHKPEDLFIDQYTGDRLAMNQISWFIKKNDILQDMSTFRRRFARDFKKPGLWSHTLVSSDLEVPPPRMEVGVSTHCTIYANLSQTKGNFKRRWRKLQPYYSAEYSLVMGLKNNNLTMFLEYQGQMYGINDVVFE